MIQSMTAFASRTGAHDNVTWAWEMRGVNARGLDLRLRFPDGLAALEGAARTMLSARLSRGNVTLNLRMGRTEGQGGLLIDREQLDRVLLGIITVRDRAGALGLMLAEPRATDILSQRGVVVQSQPDGATDEGLIPVLTEDLDRLLDDFVAMRKAEGEALMAVLAGQIAEIERLIAAAGVVVETRRADARANLHAALRRAFEDVPEMDEARIAQELALLAVKADITEELDRLTAHVAAARALLIDPKPQGRRLDFLSQEFNREANTLCSKAQSADLTRIGLDLKAVIDQLREQVQNVE